MSNPIAGQPLTSIAADLSRAQMVQLARNAFESCWLPPQDRQSLLARLAAYAA